MKDLTPLRTPICVTFEYVEEVIDFLSRYNKQWCSNEQNAVTVSQGYTSVVSAQKRVADAKSEHWNHVKRSLKQQGIDWRCWSSPSLPTFGGYEPKIDRGARTITLGCTTIPFADIDLVHKAMHEDDEIPF